MTPFLDHNWIEAEFEEWKTMSKAERLFFSGSWLLILCLPQAVVGCDDDGEATDDRQ